MRISFFWLVISVATAFSIQKNPPAFVQRSTHRLSKEEANDEEEEEPKLVLDDVEGQMAKLKSKYPTSEVDYLAAARARNAQKQQSSDRAASDKDWQDIAEQKKQQMGEIDDWESSKKEAGNVDSQILIPFEQSGEDDDEDSDEPKLLLF